MTTTFPQSFNHQKVGVSAGTNKVVFPKNTHGKISILVDVGSGATGSYQYTYSTPEDVSNGVAVWSAAVNASSDTQSQIDAPVTCLKLSSLGGATVFTVLG